MAEFVLLRLQVFAAGLAGRYLERNRIRDREAISLQADELARVVREQSHRLDAQVSQNLCTDPVITLVGLESQAFVGLDGIEPLILQLVRADFVRETDPTSFLIEIE